MNTKQLIESGKAVLGIEFGSTRNKAVLIDDERVIIRTKLEKPSKIKGLALI